jgi:hypothetical protein
VGSHYDRITPEQAALIETSPMFFVASASSDLSQGPEGQGPVNVSPRGGTPLHIIDDCRVAFLDYVGSGNETARHATSGGPVTIMVMSMDGENAAVVRLYGRATAVPVAESELAARLLAAPAESLELPVRHIVDRVPVYEFKGQRVRAQRGRLYKAR